MHNDVTEADVTLTTATSGVDLIDQQPQRLR